MKNGLLQAKDESKKSQTIYQFEIEWKIIFIFLATIFIFYSTSQAIAKQTQCNDTTCDVKFNYKTKKNKKIEKHGIIINNQFIECEVVKKENVYMLAFGGTDSWRPVISFDCSIIQNDNIFNNNPGDKKEGIWIESRCYFKKIKSMTMYSKNKIIRKIYFRTNGTVKVVLTWKKGQNKLPNIERINRRGFRIGGSIRDF